MAEIRAREARAGRGVSKDAVDGAAISATTLDPKGSSDQVRGEPDQSNGWTRAVCFTVPFNKLGWLRRCGVRGCKLQVA